MTYEFYREKIFELLQDKDILLVIDNAEDTLKEDGPQLKEIWYELLG